MSASKEWTIVIADDKNEIREIKVKSSGIRYELIQADDSILLSRDQLVDLQRVLYDIAYGD